MKTYRLLPELPGAWGRYEDFRERVRMFNAKYLPDSPTGSTIRDLDNKWINGAVGTGFWLAYNDAGQPCAHLCAYKSNYYEQPYIWFYQIEFDAGESILEPLHRVAEQIAGWVGSLNQIYELAKRPERITYGESASWVDPKIYERMFAHIGFTPKASRTIFRWNFNGAQH